MKPVVTRSLTLCLIAAHASSFGAWAEDRVEGTEPEVGNGAVTIRSGRLEAGFSAKRGLFVRLDSTPVLERSNLLVRNASGRQILDRLGRGEVKISKQDDAGVPTLTARCLDGRSSDFRYAYRIRLPDEGEVEVRLYYVWRGEGQVRVEYCAGLLATNPTKGAAYRLVEGESESAGKLPVGYPAVRWLADPFDLRFDRLAIDSRLGVLAMEAEAESPPLLRRLPSVTDEYHAGSMSFWVGWPRLTVEPDVPTECVLRLRVPRSDRRRTVICHPGAEPAGGEPVDVPDALAPETRELEIIPTPQHLEQFAEDFLLNERTRIVAPDATGPQDSPAKALQAYLRDRFDLSLDIVESWGDDGPTNCLVIGQGLFSPEVDSLCRDEKMFVSPYDPGPEGYVLIVRPERVLVAGSDPAGTYYGAQTLKQLLAVRANGQVVMRGVKIRDWPDFGFRGVHLLADDHALELHTELISKLLAPLKVNNVILECERGKWDSHPEIAQPWAMSKQHMRELRDVAAKHFIRITPLVQSLGHSEWMFDTGYHADLIEDPSHPYAYCPSNPKSYELLFDIYKEALEVFEPEYLHIGHDEVTNRGKFGSCFRCRNTPASVLLADDVRKIHRFLGERGVRTMMWGDMLLRPGEAEDAVHGGAPYNTGEARAAIPRDVALCDWHYSPYRDYPSARVLAREGFEVVASTWHNLKNIYYFSRSAKRYDALGLLQTTWTGHNGNQHAIERHPEQLYAYVTAAEFAWTAATPRLEELGYRRNEVFRQHVFPEPEVLEQTPGFIVPLTQVANVNIADNGVPGDWLNYGHLHDLRRLPSGRLRVDNALFDLIVPLSNGRRAAAMLRGTYTDPLLFPEEVTLVLDREAESLLFAHTTAWPVPKLTQVGSYEIRYADGAAETVPLTYGDNIHAWDDQTATRSESVLWSGKTLGGVPWSVGGFRWTNPHPQRRIDRVVIKSAGTDASPVLLALTGVSPRSAPVRTAAAEQSSHPPAP